MGRFRSVVACAVVAASSSAAWAATTSFYTLDNVADRLKIVDTAGSLTDVGALGRNVLDPELFMYGGNLYAIDSHLGDRVDLLQINTATGVASLLATVKLSGTNIKGAEALTVSGGDIWLGFETGSTGASNLRGRMLLDGTIVAGSVVNTGLDLDSLLSLDATSTNWLAWDINNPSSATVRVYGGTVPSVVIGSFATATGRPNDAVFAGGDIWGMSYTIGSPSVGGALVRLNPSGVGVAASVAFSATGGYSTLAEATAVPVPAAAWMGLVGLAFAVRARSRLRRGRR